MSTPGQWAGGLTAWAPEGADAGYRASATAASDGRAFVVPSADLGRLVGEWLPFAKHLITGIYGTIRSIDATARELAKLAALGEHSAPPCARAQQSGGGRDAGRRASRRDVRRDDVAAHRARRAGHRPRGDVGARRPAPTAGRRAERRPGALAAMDREDAIGTWLDARGVEHGWDLASPLAAAGADPTLAGRRRGGRRRARRRGGVALDHHHGGDRRVAHRARRRDRAGSRASSTMPARTPR